MAILETEAMYGYTLEKWLDKIGYDETEHAVAQLVIPGILSAIQHLLYALHQYFTEDVFDQARRLGCHGSNGSSFSSTNPFEARDFLLARPGGDLGVSASSERVDRFIELDGITLMYRIVASRWCIIPFEMKSKNDAEDQYLPLRWRACVALLVMEKCVTVSAKAREAVIAFVLPSPWLPDYDEGTQ